MKMRAGESVVDRLEAIEDTKGNSGDRGKMIVTTLRIIWHSVSMARVSLCEWQIIRLGFVIYDTKLFTLRLPMFQLTVTSQRLGVVMNYSRFSSFIKISSSLYVHD